MALVSKTRRSRSLADLLDLHIDMSRVVPIHEGDINRVELEPSILRWLQFGSLANEVRLAAADGRYQTEPGCMTGAPQDLNGASHHLG